jgi:hypothetical protein
MLQVLEEEEESRVSLCSRAVTLFGDWVSFGE